MDKHLTKTETMTIAERLALPMDYKWKIQSFNKAKTKASCVAYIDARDVMDRLDRVVDIDGWRDHYRRDSKDRLVCRLELKIGDTWGWKEDIGVESDNEGEKGEYSDAFKRAAVKWGIGRFLYDMEIKWLDIKVVEKNGYKVKEYYYNGQKVNQYKLEEVFNNKVDNKVDDSITESSDKNKIYGEHKGDFCDDCGKLVTDHVAEYSKEKYGKRLCFDCQSKQK